MCLLLLGGVPTFSAVPEAGYKEELFRNDSMGRVLASGVRGSILGCVSGLLIQTVIFP